MTVKGSAISRQPAASDLSPTHIQPVGNATNIILVGFMGTGKTAVGKRLAEVLGCRFIDTDRLVEERQGMTVSEIFETQGAQVFRAIEKQVVSALDGVASKERCVISAGGGTIVDPENLERLKAMGQMVCLTADPDVIHRRTADQDVRPLLRLDDDHDPREMIVDLLARRVPFYAKADLFIDTSQRDVGQVVTMVMNHLRTNDE